MLSKNEAKYIQSLYHKKNRDTEGLFVAEGEKTVAELMASDWQIEKIYAVKEWLNVNSLQQQFQEVEHFELERLSKLSNANHVLAVVHQKKLPPLQPTKGITLILDGIQDPGNMGTIIRTADWFGFTNIVASSDCVDVYNNKVIQSSMGSFLRVDVHYTNLPAFLQQNKLLVYGAMLNGENLFATTVAKDALIIIGSEGEGVSADVMPFITHKLTIPGKGKAESLNAAIAAAIIMAKVAH